MSASAFVDTNILLYAHDPSTGDKHRHANTLVQQLWRQGNGALSTQVLQEFYVNLLRKTREPPDPQWARQLVEDYLYWTVIVNDGPALLQAVDLQLRYQLSFWDALIVQAANRADAEILYTEDLNHGQHYGRVIARNPFLIDA